MPSLRLGDALGEVAEIGGADQLAHIVVIAWRHRPVSSGGAAVPDPPLRVPAFEPLQLSVLVVPARAGGHGGRPRAAGGTGAAARCSAAARAAPASPDMAPASMPQGGRGWRAGRPAAAGR